MVHGVVGRDGVPDANGTVDHVDADPMRRDATVAPGSATNGKLDGAHECSDAAFAAAMTMATGVEPEKCIE